MTDHIQTKLAKLIRHADDTVEVNRRFQRMLKNLEPWAEQWSLPLLHHRLAAEDLDLREREKTLVALAIEASPASGAAIDAYDPGDARRHRIFHRIARIEWNKRQSPTRPSQQVA